MATEVARGATLRPLVSEQAAAEGWLVATDLAEALARDGFPFHSAHKLVGRLVLHSVQNGKKPGDWTAESLTAFAPEFKPEHALLLDPREGMKTRQAKGGTGPAAVQEALRSARSALAAMRDATPIW
jgi:argininosuccinate lyase